MADYSDKPDETDDVMTLAEFRDGIDCGCFTDYDGYGYAAREEDGEVRMSHTVVNPSSVDRIPTDATHVVWFNK